MSDKEIKKWEECYSNYNIYIKPIVDYKESRKRALKMYKV